MTEEELEAIKKEYAKEVEEVGEIKQHWKDMAKRILDVIEEDERDMAEIWLAYKLMKQFKAGGGASAKNYIPCETCPHWRSKSKRK